MSSSQFAFPFKRLPFLPGFLQFFFEEKSTTQPLHEVLQSSCQLQIAKEQLTWPSFTSPQGGGRRRPRRKFPAVGGKSSSCFFLFAFSGVEVLEEKGFQKKNVSLKPVFA